MKSLNKIATAFFAVALGLMSMTSCEGGDLFSVDSPDWLSAKVDSIANAKGQGGEEEIEGLVEDVYTVGATDFSTGWWAQFSKYYQIPEGQKWVAQYNLSINPNASNTYKNFALIITNDEDRAYGTLSCMTCTLLSPGLSSAAGNLCSGQSGLCALSLICEVANYHCVHQILVRSDAENSVVKLSVGNLVACHIKYGNLRHSDSSFH